MSRRVLVEVLKRLIEQEVIVPTLQQDGMWGLMLRYEMLAQTPISALIPASVGELLRAQLELLSPAAWALLVAAAVLGERLAFERLCSIARLDEETGVQALEEVIRQGWLCEDTPMEELEEHYYIFPGEIIRAVVYQKAGAVRQHQIQRRAAVVCSLGSATVA